MQEYDVAIIGGGPAGSSAALHLCRAGFSVCLLEKARFPRETVCGEFLSTEVSECLKSLGLFEEFLALSPNPLRHFRLFHSAENAADALLPSPVYGLRRGVFDSFLLDSARNAGTDVVQPGDVQSVAKNGSVFTLAFNAEGLMSKINARSVVGAYGRWNALDRQLRDEKSTALSPCTGIKVHIDVSEIRGLERDTIALFGGAGMYCGINAVDRNVATISLLEQRSGSHFPPRKCFDELLRTNDALQELLPSARLSGWFDGKVYGTGRMYFGERRLVNNGVFMIGDAARVIPPLVGDGIGMAMESGRMIAELFQNRRAGKVQDADAERVYTLLWDRRFRRRVTMANTVHQIMMRDFLRGSGVWLARNSSRVLPAIISASRSPV